MKPFRSAEWWKYFNSNLWRSVSDVICVHQRFAIKKFDVSCLTKTFDSKFENEKCPPLHWLSSQARTNFPWRYVFKSTRAMRLFAFSLRFFKALSTSVKWTEHLFGCCALYKFLLLKLTPCDLVVTFFLISSRTPDFPDFTALRVRPWPQVVRICQPDAYAVIVAAWELTGCWLNTKWVYTFFEVFFLELPHLKNLKRSINQSTLVNPYLKKHRYQKSSR